MEETAVDLLKENVSIEIIARVTKLSAEKILKLQEELLVEA